MAACRASARPIPGVALSRSTVDVVNRVAASEATDQCVTSRWNGSAVSAPCRPHQKDALVLHQGFDGSKQCDIELIAARKIEQCGLAGAITGLASSPPRNAGDLSRQGFRAKRYPFPI
jgi:hypothetical protein